MKKPMDSKWSQELNEVGLPNPVLSGLYVLFQHITAIEQRLEATEEKLFPKSPTPCWSCKHEPNCWRIKDDLVPVPPEACDGFEVLLDKLEGQRHD